LKRKEAHHSFASPNSLESLDHLMPTELLLEVLNKISAAINFHRVLTRRKLGLRDDTAHWITSLDEEGVTVLGNPHVLGAS
jgi:hypothetical protein